MHENKNIIYTLEKKEPVEENGCTKCSKLNELLKLEQETANQLLEARFHIQEINLKAQIRENKLQYQSKEMDFKNQLLEAQIRENKLQSQAKEMDFKNQLLEGQIRENKLKTKVQEMDFKNQLLEGQIRENKLKYGF
jgi:actin-related protein